MGIDREKIDAASERQRIEDSLRLDFEATLPQRVSRHLQVKPCPIIPNTHFAKASVECAALYQDGHFYGAIALAQAVAEALVKFLCQRHKWRPGKVFEKNVDKLSKMCVVSDELKGRLLAIWEHRDDYHHLNAAVETDRQTLEELAGGKSSHLAKVESEVFRSSSVDDKLVLGDPRLWDVSDGLANVFLRFEP